MYVSGAIAHYLVLHLVCSLPFVVVLQSPKGCVDKEFMHKNALWEGPTLFRVPVSIMKRWNIRSTHTYFQSAARFPAFECRFGEYDLHDLVELDQMTAGVMIAADAETCQILTNRNAVSPLHNLRYVCMFITRTYIKQTL